MEYEITINQDLNFCHIFYTAENSEDIELMNKFVEYLQDNPQRLVATFMPSDAKNRKRLEILTLDPYLINKAGEQFNNVMGSRPLREMT